MANPEGSGHGRRSTHPRQSAEGRGIASAVSVTTKTNSRQDAKGAKEDGGQRTEDGEHLDYAKQSQFPEGQDER